jgi:hypothetical protein
MEVEKNRVVFNTAIAPYNTLLRDDIVMKSYMLPRCCRDSSMHVLRFALHQLFAPSNMSTSQPFTLINTVRVSLYDVAKTSFIAIARITTSQLLLVNDTSFILSNPYLLQV